MAFGLNTLAIQQKGNMTLSILDAEITLKADRTLLYTEVAESLSSACIRKVLSSTAVAQCSTRDFIFSPSVRGIYFESGASYA